MHSKKIIITLGLFLTLVCFLPIVACKNRSNSELKAPPGGFPPQVDGPIISALGTTTANVVNGGRIQIFEFASATTSAAYLNISLIDFNGGKWTKQPYARFYEKSAPGTILAEGAIGEVNTSSWLNSAALVLVDKSDYILELDLTGITGAVINLQTSSEIKEIADALPKSMKLDDHVETHVALPSKSLPFTLHLDAPALVMMGVNGEVFRFGKKFLPDDDSKKDLPKVKVKYKADSKIQIGNVSGINGAGFYDFITFDLPAGDHPMEIELQDTPGNTIADLNIFARQWLVRHQQPATGTEVLKPIDLDWSIRSKDAFGHVKSNDPLLTFEVNSPGEVLLNLSLKLARPLNLNAKEGPVSFPLEYRDASGNVVARATVKRENGLSHTYREKVYAKLPKGAITVSSDLSSLKPNDRLSVAASVALSDRILPEGGEPLSAFDDPLPVTTTPAMDYNADSSVPPAPPTYVPAAKPVRLAMKSVLTSMEQTRSKFHLQLVEGTPRSESNAIDSVIIAGCLGNAAQHWSDIIIHFYCQHGAARGCYTSRAPNGRKQAYEDCKTDEHFKWIVANQGDVFQYVMFSQTYAFSDEDQQRVINAFYRVNDPNNLAECKSKRPVRGIDPEDGTHCQVNKKYSPVMQAAGR